MVQGILLAAGSGSRFGGNKLLHPLEGNTPMVLVAALRLQPQVDRLLVVVRPADDLLIQLLRAQGIETLPCQQSHLGMGHSIACGVAHTPQAAAWVIALADMPYIEGDTLRTLVNLLRIGAPIAAPLYQQHRGHPVGFGRQYFDELVQLRGDQGARAVVERHAEAFRGFVCQDPGVLRDIDRPQDVGLLH